MSPKTEISSGPVRLRFEGIRVERAGVIGDVEIMDPLKFSKHVAERNPPPPILQVTVDPLGFE
jgi:hypothetical protein